MMVEFTKTRRLPERCCIYEPLILVCVGLSVTQLFIVTYDPARKLSPSSACNPIKVCCLLSWTLMNLLPWLVLNTLFEAYGHL